MEPLPTMIEEGLADEFKGRKVEMLPADGVVWCEAPESATQLLTEVAGGVNAMVLKEFARDCWSQLPPVQGPQPGTGAGAACGYTPGCPGAPPGGTAM